MHAFPVLYHALFSIGICSLAFCYADSNFIVSLPLLMPVIYMYIRWYLFLYWYFVLGSHFTPHILCLISDQQTQQ